MNDFLVFNVIFKYKNWRFLYEKSFEELEGTDLIIYCIYECGDQNHAYDVPLPKIFPSLGSGGGFRKKKRDDDENKFA